MLRSVDPAVFVPRPQVGSALLRLRRSGPGAPESVARLVRQSFAPTVASRWPDRWSSPVRGPSGLASEPSRRSADRRTLGPRSSRPASSSASPRRSKGRERSCERETRCPSGCSLRPSSPCLPLRGAAKEDGLHEIRSLFEPLELADELRISESEEDEVICEGIEAPDLTATALAALREHGWDGPRLRIEVSKRVPVAAGLGGGSADAAAVVASRSRARSRDSSRSRLRSAPTSPRSQPRPCLVAGAGRGDRAGGDPAEHGVVRSRGRRSRHGRGLRRGRSPRLAKGGSRARGVRRRLRDAVDEGGSPLAYREHWSTTCSRRRSP